MKRRCFINYLVCMIATLPIYSFSKNAKEVLFSRKKSLDFEMFVKGKEISDYSEALQAALNFCSVNDLVLILSKEYVITKTLHLPNRVNILGYNNAIIKCREDEPITILLAEGKSNIKIIDLCIDGNVIGDVGKNFTRATRFIDCQNIMLESIMVSNSADWAISFEECSNVKAKNIKVYGGGRGRPGGRDGIHFLDSSDIDVDGADIISGDDCVAVTSKNKNIKNINLKNVSGSSDIGSIVIYNEEQYKSKVYSHSQLTNLKIENISVKDGGRARDIVRVYSYNPKTIIENVSVGNVTGQSRNHAVFLGGIKYLSLKEVNVSSVNQDGVHIKKCSNIILNKVMGRSFKEKNFGISIRESSNVKGDCTYVNDDRSRKLLIENSNLIDIKETEY